MLFLSNKKSFIMNTFDKNLNIYHIYIHINNIANILKNVYILKVFHKHETIAIEKNSLINQKSLERERKNGIKLGTTYSCKLLLSFNNTNY